MSEWTLRLVAPTLAGGRIRARKVLAEQLPDRDFDGRRIDIDCRGVLAASPSFIDEIVSQLCGNRGADLMVVNASDELGGKFLDAARRHNATDLVAVRHENSMRFAVETQQPLEDPSQRLRARLEAFSRDCVTHGDMTPAAARMLNRILEEEK